MGQGNFRPSNYIEERGYEMVYVDMIDTDPYDMDIAYDSMIEDILNLLPKSFKSTDGKFEQRPDENIAIIAENGLFRIGIADNQSSYAVLVYVKEDAPFFAKANLEGFANQLFNKLNEHFNLLVRYDAWTSAKYIER